VKSTKQLALAVVAITALVAVAAPPEVSYSKDVQPIFDKACVECHGAKKAKAKLNLDAAVALKSLVDVPSEQVPGTVRVKPGDPEQSYLWLKLDHRSKEGDGMPKGMFGAKKLPQAELDLIKAWIAGGAKE
jgi:mono/diheme cytochrome c family protein